MLDYFQWETIGHEIIGEVEEKVELYTDRAEVINGWLVRTMFLSENRPVINMCFVEDVNHEWETNLDEWETNQ